MSTTTKEVHTKESSHYEEKKDKKEEKKADQKKTYEYDGPIYRPLVSPRTTIITRSAYGPNVGVGSKTVSSSVVASRGVGSYSSHVPAGAYAKLTQTGVSNVKNDRQKEKKDMQDLNERLGSYIEKVRFLEAQNRKLVDELDKLKLKWGKETGSIKVMFQAELEEARKLLVEAEREKARLEIRCASLEEQVEELRAK
jgi:intermediate filament protein if